MEKKSLGVIGGMGPKATCVFFDKIIENTDAHNDQDHINMIILNHATLPDRTTAIFNNTEAEFLNSIEKDIKLLQMTDVSNIAIPCNTAHYFYDNLKKMTDINIINMIDETAKELYNLYGENSKVAILGTKGTLSSRIYETACKKYNIDLIVPSENVQDETMKIIYDKVKSGLTEDDGQLEYLIMDFIEKQNCKAVIIACTELSTIKLSQKVKKYTVDALEVLVNRSIKLSGKNIK